MTAVVCLIVGFCFGVMYTTDKFDKIEGEGADDEPV